VRRRQYFKRHAISCERETEKEVSIRKLKVDERFAIYSGAGNQRALSSVRKLQEAESHSKVREEETD
jgi:hypothetical protein